MLVVTLQNLIDSINEAWSDTVYPGDDQLVDPPAGYENRDYPEIAAAFQGKEWQTLTPWFLLEESEALSLLAPKALIYYFPAYLTSSLLAPFQLQAELQSRVVYALKPKFPPRLEGYFLERASQFDQRQSHVIGLFLHYIYETYAEWWQDDIDDDIEEAIQYWSANSNDPSA